MGSYRDVRALSRGMKILEALARLGWTKPSTLSVATDIDRSTTYRLVDTLVADGYVTRRAEDGAVALTRKVKAVAAGVRDDDMVLTIVGRHLAKLVQEVKWPSDFARLSNGTITIEESTHSLSPVTFHRSMIGQPCSMVRSSLGQAILSVLTPDEIATTTEFAARIGRGAEAADIPQAAARAVRQVRRLGYVAAIGAHDPNVSAIAVPLRTNETVGAVNIVFFRKVMSPEEAANRFLGHLRTCVDGIVADLSPGRPACESRGRTQARPLADDRVGMAARQTALSSPICGLRLLQGRALQRSDRAGGAFPHQR